MLVHTQRPAKCSRTDIIEHGPSYKKFCRRRSFLTVDGKAATAGKPMHISEHPTQVTCYCEPTTARCSFLISM